MKKRKNKIDYTLLKGVTPRTERQREYLKAIDRKDLVFGVGSAGSGKTYLAVAKAVWYYSKNKVDKIILVRPAVASEKLGYLPGTLEDKMDPYLRPLFDCLDEHYGAKTVNGMIEDGDIEIAPLAYMKGRTLKNCFIILDEAQNATKEQIKTFLTRFGDNIKCVITGDTDQSDIKDNGLSWALEKLENCPVIETIEFNNTHVIRSYLVKEILKYLCES